MVSGGFFQPCVPDDEQGRVDCSIKERMDSFFLSDCFSPDCMQELGSSERLGKEKGCLDILLAGVV